MPELDESLLTPRQLEVWRAYEEAQSQRIAAEVLGVHHSYIGKTLKTIEKKLAAAEGLEDSPGVMDGLQEAGVSPTLLRHGWQKTDAGSYFFKLNHDDDHEAIEERWTRRLEAVRPLPLIAPPREGSAAQATIYGVWDLHAGMRAWAQESGEHYDLETAVRLVREGVSDLVCNSPSAAEGVLILGGDTLHMDDNRSQTPQSGHALDVGARIEEAGEAVIEMVVQTVAGLLEKHQRVEVVVLRGNHDPNASRWLRMAIRRAFSANERVDVWRGDGDIWARRWGVFFCAAMHGDKRKPGVVANALPALFPDWSAALIRWLLYGHGHHGESGTADNGTFHRMFEPVTPRDAYAAHSPYVAGRCMSAITIHQDLGPRAELWHPILPRAA